MAKSKSFYKKKHHQKQKHSKRKHGGNCSGTTSSWAEQVVGAYPHSAQAGTPNLIQQQVPSVNNAIMSGGMSELSPDLIDPNLNKNVPNAQGSVPILTVGSVSGGKKRSNKRKGGNVISELAVPAVLLVANQTFGNKTGKHLPYNRKRFSRRYRRGRR